MKFYKLAKIFSKYDKRVSVYLQIERELIMLTQEKQDRNNLVSEDYEKALLTPAIERVAGNALARIKDDHTFEMKLIEFKKLYTRWYYAIAYQYRLPTLRIVPFLLRLIRVG